MKKILLIMLILIFISGCKETNTTEPSEIYTKYLKGREDMFTFKPVTAMFIIDCSLPEIYENQTIEIVYGEAVYNNTNTIEIPFTEFCERLNSNKK